MGSGRACDFLVAVTARFQVLFVFVAMEISRRRILHCNVIAHPTDEWTLQQFPSNTGVGRVRR